MREMVEEMVILRRMQWLGHVARMTEHRLPKQILFGRLPKARPFQGVKLRWKDRVMKDMVLLRLRGSSAPDKQAKSTRSHQQVNEVHGHRETSFGSAATLAIEHK